MWDSRVCEAILKYNNSTSLLMWKVMNTSSVSQNAGDEVGVESSTQRIFNMIENDTMPISTADNLAKEMKWPHSWQSSLSSSSLCHACSKFLIGRTYVPLVISKTVDSDRLSARLGALVIVPAAWLFAWLPSFVLFFYPACFWPDGAETLW